jgi:hypothetical protein
MNLRSRFGIVAVALLGFLACGWGVAPWLRAQDPLGGAAPQDPAPYIPDPRSAKLPNGKSQLDAILKAEHAQNLKDAAQLVDLCEQLKLDLEKNEHFVLPLATIKKTDEIEKLVKKIRARLRHD